MIICVFAEPPLPGQCLRALVPFHDPAWLARLYAAMLRDTLDGLEVIPADRYVVLTNADEAGRRVLERQLPVPWTLLNELEDLGREDALIVACANAPSAHIEPLLAVDRRQPFHVVGPGTDDESVWLVGASEIRAERTNLVTLPPATIVDGQPALATLIEELRLHHERAPRTALLAMTS